MRASGTLTAAWCNPKGRVVVTGRLLWLGDAVGFVVPAEAEEPVRKRLAMYRLRSKVDIERDDAMASIAISVDRLPEPLGTPASEPGAVVVSGAVTAVRLWGPALEIHAPAETIEGLDLDPADRLGDEAWRLARIEAGLVDIDPANAERFTPHMLNLDRTGALSFRKGCYTGQEVVARTENLGKVKRRANRYRLASGAATIGEKLTDGEATVGEVVNAAGDQLLAVVPVARAADALTLAGVTATPLPLPYALD